MTGSTILTRERADLTDEQAVRRPTPSALDLAGLIEHVAATEAGWVRSAEGGAEAMHRNRGPDAATRHWHLAPGETLAGVLSHYEAVTRHTDELVGPPRVPARHRRDCSARRPRRHPAGVDRRPEDDGLTRRSSDGRAEDSAVDVADGPDDGPAGGGARARAGHLHHRPPQHLPAHSPTDCRT
jgi:hypothetical protein